MDSRNTGLDTLRPQVQPHSPGEGILTRHTDVGDLHSRRVPFRSSSHRGEDLNLGLVTVREKLSLGSDVVDSVDDPVGSLEESVALWRVSPKGDRSVDAGEQRMGNLGELVNSKLPTGRETKREEPHVAQGAIFSKYFFVARTLGDPTSARVAAAVGEENHWSGLFFKS